MRVYLVQHGEAESMDVDPQRPLTDHGRRVTQRMAEMAAKLDLGVGEIRHSGKTRAQQTAGLFARALSLMGEVNETPNLGPTDDVKPVAQDIQSQGQSVMLVGHLPFMSHMAGYLVNQNPDDSPVEFHNSGILCLERGQDGWQVLWHLTPD